MSYYREYDRKLPSKMDDKVEVRPVTKAHPEDVRKTFRPINGGKQSSPDKS